MPKKDSVSFACYTCMQYLKQMRLHKNISMKEIASYLSMHGIKRDEKTLYGWENGQAEPPLEALLLIARYLDCPDLFAISGIPFSPFSSEEPAFLTQTERQLLKGYRSDEDLHTILEKLLAFYEKQKS